MTQGELDLTELRRNDFYEHHGWWLWAAWMPVGLLLLCTKRYGKRSWSCMHLIHAILGYFTLVVTLVWVFKILDYFNWQVNTDLHSIAGLIAVSLCLVVALSGTTTAGLQQFYVEKEWTPREKVTRVGKFHRIAGYFALFVGNSTAMTGVAHYYADIVMDDHMVPLGVASFCTFCFLVMLCECVYRRTHRQADMVVETPDIHDPVNKSSQMMIYSPE